MRPKPVIKEWLPPPRWTAPDEILNVRGNIVGIYGSEARELWINVTNEGKSSVKRMRSRARIHLIRFGPERPATEKPPGMSNEDWDRAEMSTSSD